MALIAHILERYATEPGGLMPALHAIQQDLGYIPADAYPDIAAALNVSAAEVHGVVSFYHDFRTEPAGRKVVRICQAESCQACGARELTAHAEQRLGIAMGQTRADGEVTLQAVYCLGNCACSPAIAIDEQSYALVDSARFDELTQGFAREHDT